MGAASSGQALALSTKPATRVPGLVRGISLLAATRAAISSISSWL
jgi:hypothetical protein